MNPKLAPRQLQCLRSIIAGNTNKDTAIEMGVSVKTVESVRWAIYTKLCVDAPIPLVRAALRAQLITVEEFMASRIGENVSHFGPGRLKERNALAGV